MHFMIVFGFELNIYQNFAQNANTLIYILSMMRNKQSVLRVWTK